MMLDMIDGTDSIAVAILVARSFRPWDRHHSWAAVRLTSMHSMSFALRRPTVGSEAKVTP
jgi:hypothetical protein